MYFVAAPFEDGTQSDNANPSSAASCHYRLGYFAYGSVSFLPLSTKYDKIRQKIVENDRKIHAEITNVLKIRPTNSHIIRNLCVFYQSVFPYFLHTFSASGQTNYEVKGMLIVFLRAIVLYIFVIFAIRLMGKRQIGELQPSELVVTILVSNIATLPIEDTSIPMSLGILPILILVCLDVIMSGATLKFRRLRSIISGNPKIIIRDGVLDQKQMKILRFSLDDIMEALHQDGVFDISEVQFAIVETTGKISVYQKPEYQPLTNGDAGVTKKAKNPPAIIINDGIVIDDAFPSVKINRGWIDKLLSRKGLSVRDVFLLTVSEDLSYNLIKKER